MDKTEGILTLKLLLKERKRRFNENKLLRYNKGKKVHKKQLEFHRCNKKNRWVLGGNRTGKTECGAAEAVWLARGNHPYRQNRENAEGWVVSLSTQVQRDVAQKKILHYLNRDWIEDITMISGRKNSPEYGIIDQILIRNVFGGISTIGFKSVDQGREKFQGTSLDFVWFDEEPPYDIYLECKMRVLDRVGEIFGTMTPLKGQSWVYNEIYLNSKNDSEVWFEHISWQDNPFLNQEEIKKLKSELSREELDSRCDGKFVAFGGMVYSNFDESVNVIEPFDVPKEWQDNISIDPGFRNPLSCHFYACDFDGNIYVIAEWYRAETDIETHAKMIHQIADRLGWKKNSNGQLTALIDSAALQKTLSSQRSVADLFYDYNILVNPKVNKDLFTGIQRVRNYIRDANGNTKLFIFKNCVNLIREIKGYFWSESEVPFKTEDHALDELRYYIITKPHTSPPKVPVSPQFKYKQKLMGSLKRQRQGFYD